METINELKYKLQRAKEKAFDNAKSKDEIIEIWKQDKRTKIPKNKKRYFCVGCRMNYYNGQGASECWSLSKSKLKERKLYQSLNSVTPEKEITLNCFVRDYKR